MPSYLSAARQFVLSIAFLLPGFSRADDNEWFAFNPPNDAFRESAIDMRWLNEKFAGEHEVIAAKGDEFVFSGNQQPVRFWP